MAKGAEQHRLAFTVFAEPTELWRTVVDLLEGGLSESQVCIVASAPTLQLFAPTATASGDLLDRIEALHLGVQECLDLPDASSEPRIVASEGPLLSLALKSQAAVAGAPTGGCRRTRPASDLLALVRRGFVGLIVGSFDPPQQLHVTRTLLDNTHYWVITYEQQASTNTEETG